MAQINGTPGRDILEGTGGDDVLRGLGGNDRLYGFGGTDFLYGGDGDDFLNSGDNRDFDWIDTGKGNDIVDFSDALSPSGFHNLYNAALDARIIVTIRGAANSASIDKGANGTTQVWDVAKALASAGLRVTGTAYDDIFRVNPGDGGTLFIRDYGGNDTINILRDAGMLVLDYKHAATGVIVNLQSGEVSEDGFGGQDIIKGSGRVHEVLGSGTGNDVLRGTDANETLRGFGGNDALYGGGGNDTLYGGDGDDYLEPGNNSHFDWIDTGAGNDLVSFASVTDRRAFFNLDHSGLDGGINVALDGTANTALIDKGTNGTTQIADIAKALHNGGLRIIGSAFDDTYSIDPGNGGLVQIRNTGGNDTINIAASSGTVVLDYSRKGGISASLENGIVYSDGTGRSDTITGPGIVNEFRSSMSSDTIYGSANDETFALYAGVDTLFGRGGNDTVSYAFSGAGAVTLDLALGSATGLWQERTFSHSISDISNASGSLTGADSLRGDSGNNLLAGNGGDDRLFGRGGNDRLTGGDGNDRLLGGAGDDTLTGDGPLADFHLPGLADRNTGKDILKGGAGRDTLLGGARADRLYGDGGNDTLDGGAGNDRLTGGAGNDRFVFSAGNDRITDFDTASNREKIDLSGIAAIRGFRDLSNNHLSEAGGEAVITDGAGNTLTLLGVTMADLDKGDFIF